MRASASICALALAACTEDNPRYDGAGDTEPPAGTTEEPEGGTEEPEGTTEEPEPEPECEVPPPRPLGISVALGGEAWAPECPEGASKIVRFTVGAEPVELAGGRLELPACEGDCNCPLEDPQTLVVELGDDVVLTESIGAFGCGRVELWTTEGPDGCQWTGLVHYDNVIFPVLPSFIAANELSVPPLSLFEGYALTLGLAPEDVCTELEPCESGYLPGRHALDALGQAEVAVDDPPVPVDLVATYDGTVYTYLFDNREALVTLECETRASWTAQRLP